jgi:hypothetical protein
MALDDTRRASAPRLNMLLPNSTQLPSLGGGGARPLPWFQARTTSPCVPRTEGRRRPTLPRVSGLAVVVHDG